ncbi:uncharacterized protein SOCEGT47_049050 [Sorangium cellulosum]|uniref:Uncharacterized protein n=1 Tax=Sorangium cellulosum TaxID=56 RepID=A0A4P2Q5N4_SORCE|nr:uncharacterized protein SOCEGT47_049050 [Sorangium cellulosum]
MAEPPCPEAVLPPAVLVEPPVAPPAPFAASGAGCATPFAGGAAASGSTAAPAFSGGRRIHIEPEEAHDVSPQASPREIVRGALRDVRLQNELSRSVLGRDPSPGIQRTPEAARRTVGVSQTKDVRPQRDLGRRVRIVVERAVARSVPELNSRPCAGEARMRIAHDVTPLGSSPVGRGRPVLRVASRPGSSGDTGQHGYHIFAEQTGRVGKTSPLAGRRGLALRKDPSASRASQKIRWSSRCSQRVATRQSGSVATGRDGPGRRGARRERARNTACLRARSTDGPGRAAARRTEPGRGVAGRARRIARAGPSRAPRAHGAPRWSQVAERRLAPRGHAPRPRGAPAHALGGQPRSSPRTAPARVTAAPLAMGLATHAKNGVPRRAQCVSGGSHRGGPLIAYPAHAAAPSAADETS